MGASHALRACEARAIHTRGSRLRRFAPSETTENDCFAVYASHGLLAKTVNCLDKICTAPQMIPRPEMIPKLDRKWSRCGPQMIPAGKEIEVS